MSQPPRVQFNFEPDEPVEDTEVVVEEDFSDNEDEQSMEEDILPDRVQKPVQREKPTDDIFEDIPSQIVADLESKITKAKATKKTQKPKDPNKPKRKVDPEHMKKMKAKAAETRARKKREKEEQQKLDAEEKELMSRKKKKDLEKIKKELDEEDKPKPAPAPAPAPAPIRQMFTQEDLAKAQFEAIARYEVLRKDRKAKKKEAEKLEREKKELVDKLMGKTNQRVPGSRYASNFFEGCY
jgi:hypothetical protein